MPDFVEVSATVLAKDTAAAARDWLGRDSLTTPRVGDRRDWQGDRTQAGQSYIYQTCSECRALRRRANGGAWELAYAGQTASPCNHLWREGASLAVAEPVSDGRVVLVKRFDTATGRWVFGAFTLENQRPQLPQTDYSWRLRSDGAGKLDTGDPAVQQGLSSSQPVIAFGPFRVSWSPARDGAGYIYYGRLPGDPVGQDTVYLCITTATTFRGLDAASPTWRFKSSVVD